MKTLISTITYLFLTVVVFVTISTTFATVYPYIQKTENGKVKSVSYPYNAYDGGAGPGETFVYADGKLLYSIDEYLTSPFFTLNNGEYLIEFNFVIYSMTHFHTDDDEKQVTSENLDLRGDAIRIFKNGKLFKTIDFDNLSINSSKITIAEHGNWFSWNYNVPISNKDKLKIKMKKHPAFIEDNRLYLIAADNQLISVDITSPQIIRSQRAYETLKLKTNWNPTTISRKKIKVDYPDKFSLPILENGQTLEKGLATFLNKEISDRDSAEIKVYIHTLLINKVGKSEDFSCSSNIRKNTGNDTYTYSEELVNKIQNWIMQQTFKTDDFPKNFQKYKYSDFVYLK